jgi:hypothetical protein
MNSNEDVFVSLHGIAHNIHKISFNEYFTKVPRGLHVYTFCPTNYCVFSNEESEKMMKHFLKHPNWTSSPECMEGGMFEHCQLYCPGDYITNLILDGDTPVNYGLYLMNNPNQKLPVIFDTTKKETTYDIERILRELKPSDPRKIRNIYLCVCFPHTISPVANSVLKWKGINRPERKATLKYESFTITPEILDKAKKIQKRRMKLDQQGRKRFIIHSKKKNRPFTRSMSFPENLRNGSIDHIPSNIGKGLGEKTKISERGIYFKIDKQDQETNEVFLKYL